MAVPRHKVFIALVLLVLVVYSVTLIRNLKESESRSLQLNEQPVVGDHVSVSFHVVAINPANSEMTARVSVRLYGTIAKDPFTPSVDLRLFLNGISGPQEIELPRGRHINRITAVFAVDGNMNMYPFDRYTSSIRIMILIKAPAKRPPTSTAAETQSEVVPDEEVQNMASATNEGQPLQTASSIIASLPGIKFEGERVAFENQGIQGVDLSIRRAHNVIVVSVVFMTLMMVLALSVLLMSLRAVTAEEDTALVPLSLCVSLLFGLPALRNAQPAVPPLGVLGDYVSFLWAEIIVAVSTVLIIWVWMIRRRRALG
jgi:Domain of unknown function (DUF4436)